MENLTFLRAWRAHFFHFALSQGERGMGQLAHFISQGLSPSHNSSALSQGERGMGRLSHILFLLLLSLDKVNLTL